MTETFIYKPTTESSRSHKPRVREIKLGHGYKQIAGDGINNNLENWDVTFVVNDTVKTSINTFFKNAKGYISFYWTSNEKNATQKKYLCPEWSILPLGSNKYKITAKFEEWPI